MHAFEYKAPGAAAAASATSGAPERDRRPQVSAEPVAGGVEGPRSEKCQAAVGFGPDYRPKGQARPSGEPGDGEDEEPSHDRRAAYWGAECFEDEGVWADLGGGAASKKWAAAVRIAEQGGDAKFWDRAKGQEVSEQAVGDERRPAGCEPIERADHGAAELRERDWETRERALGEGVWSDGLAVEDQAAGGANPEAGGHKGKDRC